MSTPCLRDAPLYLPKYPSLAISPSPPPLTSLGGADGVCDVEGDDALVDRRHRFAAAAQPRGGSGGGGDGDEDQDDEEDEEAIRSSGPSARMGGGGGGRSQLPKPLPASARSLLPREAVPTGSTRVEGISSFGNGSRGDGGGGRGSGRGGGPGYQGASSGSGATAGRGGGGGGDSSGGGGRGRGGGGGGGRGRGGAQKEDRLWVSTEGRIYNYAKAGAQQVVGQAGAEQAVVAARQAAQVWGGRGGGRTRNRCSGLWVPPHPASWLAWWCNNEIFSGVLPSRPCIPVARARINSAWPILIPIFFMHL